MPEGPQGGTGEGRGGGGGADSGIIAEPAAGVDMHEEAGETAGDSIQAAWTGHGVRNNSV
ncbi:hypothetical protein [Xylella fastidiosa]|uniref:hypothetical protein n=1 Tax=Xylella fastidiosa TaxID=2371 RepID=UPI001BD58DAF|nr:hypothetical protein [Xylella fastidiosa]MBS9522384.1 hypothetical protein [Xylella fastidiosa subsp. multiplex]